jgi:hypothetical protein
MSESESAPKKVIPKPIKAADLPPKSADAPTQDREKRDRGGDNRGGDKGGRGGRKGREEEAAPRVSAALQRGPKYTPPKPAPEPVVEEEIETPEAAATEGVEASAETEAAPEAE